MHPARNYGEFHKRRRARTVAAPGRGHFAHTLAVRPATGSMNEVDSAADLLSDGHGGSPRYDA